MGERYSDDHFDSIFCSDLQRSYKSAELAFRNKFPIIKDPRLRECNYGLFTRHASKEVDLEKPRRIKEPFPKGESYEQTSERMKNSLQYLLKKYNGKRVMIVGHRATQYRLDFWIRHIPYSQSIITPWKWQPGWEYIMFETIK